MSELFVNPCKKLKRYRSKESARKVADFLRRRFGKWKKHLADFDVKECGDCGGYHLIRPKESRDARA